MFEKNELKITIQANMKVVDFLDLTMDLTNGTYKPFTKPNNVPLYVHHNSNHPPSIIKNIPESINCRLSTISSNEEVFKNAIPPYQEALTKSGYKYDLKYNPPTENDTSVGNRRNKKRQRNISWFNPPYSRNVKTNIGRKFLNLLKNCFPPDNKLHKILNQNTVKISYSCMPNIKQIINSKNKSILRKTEEQKQKKMCNCRKGKTCPMNGKCLASEIVYQAVVTREDNQSKESYIGITANTFKTRYGTHTASINPENPNKDKNSTALSKHILKLDHDKIEHNVTWKILDKAKKYSPSSKVCQLCLREKFYIICKPDMGTLNIRTEVTSPCIQRKYDLLCNKNF